MKPFVNKTDPGNEKAIKKGYSVPDGAVNLAYAKAPVLSPANNIIVVDTSRITAENNPSETQNLDIYYANGLGILQDASGNQVIQDQFPIVSDVFDQNPVTTHANDFGLFTPDMALPFVHISRYFHLDGAGLSLGATLTDVSIRTIKVVDSNGGTYVDPNGNPRFKIRITPARGTVSTTDWAYRVYAYVDTDANENLYLTYDKCELDVHGNIVNQVVNYQELLNPEPFYIYQPEEADVVDPANRDQSWFSTKPIDLKQKVLGVPLPSVDGYEVYVPKKALSDPRVFQLFRWRVVSSFTNNTVTADEATTINCGVVVTNNDTPGSAPYALLNLAQSDYNKDELTLTNPLQSDQSDANRSKASYWQVNFDTAKYSDLAQFDLLIWSPSLSAFDFTPYLGMIDYFTNSLGKILIIDTDNNTVPSGLGITTTAGVFPGQTATVAQNSSLLGQGVMAPTLAPDYTNELFDAISNRGYAISPNAQAGPLTLATITGLASGTQYVTGFNASGAYLTYAQFLYGANAGMCQYIQSYPSNYRPLVTGTFTFNVAQTVQTGGGVSYSGTTTNTVYATAETTGGAGTAVNVPTIPTGSTLQSISYGGYFQNSGTFAPVNVLVSGSGSLSVANSNGYDSGDGSVYNGASGTTTDPSLLGGSASLINQNGASNLGYGYVQVGVTYTQSYSVFVPPTFTTIQVPTVSAPQATVIFNQTPSGGGIVFSTLGILKTCSALWSYATAALIDANRGAVVDNDPNYGVYINSPNIAGAMQFLYNLAVTSVGGQPHMINSTNSFSSSFELTSPWNTSWVIDPSDGALSNDEIDLYGFSYLPADLATPTPVWQRKLSNSTCYQLVAANLTEAEKFKFDNAIRTYRIEVTNGNVDVTFTLADNSFPYAWTQAYTPNFNIPDYLRPYIIVEDSVEAQYSQAQYANTYYPPKAYAGQVSASILTSGVMLQSQTGTVTASGTATQITNLTDSATPTSLTSFQGSVEVLLNWAQSGDSQTQVGAINPYKGVTIPKGITLYSDYNPGGTSWGFSNGSVPYFGADQPLTIGSSGDFVKFIQDALNLFRTNGYFTYANPITVSGSFDLSTSLMLEAFQGSMGVSQTGAVDALTLSLIGGQILRAGNPYNGVFQDWRQFYALPFKNMDRRHISDGDPTTFYVETPTDPGSDTVFQIYFIKYAAAQEIHGLHFVPYVPGTGEVVQGYVEVLNSATTNLSTYLPNLLGGTGSTIPAGVITDNSPIDVQFNSRTGDVVAVSLALKAPLGTPRPGIRDLSGFSSVTSWNNSYTTTNTIYNSIPISYTASVTVDVTSEMVQAYPRLTGAGISEGVLDPLVRTVPGNLANIVWNSVTSSNPSISATISSSGLITASNTGTSGALSVGPSLPSGLTYYGMTPQGVVNPIPEVGWVSKSDGIKLLADVNGNPVGFPLIPTTATNQQRSFASFFLTTFGVDSTITMGFYDRKQQQFIYNLSGEPEITFVDYMSRGPNNVYIAVVTSAETSVVENIPVNLDAAKLPHRWAMPVYSVLQRNGSSISIGALSNSLGVDSFWPVPVSPGQFSRTVTVPTTTQNALANYLTSYQGSTLQAFYSLPESQQSVWSDIYGPPNVDIVGEQPLIVADNVLQVRQPPILMIQKPSPTPGPADPMLPIFKVYQRASITSPWVALDFTQIQDYNVSLGQIILTNNVIANDPRLYKVDYTAVQGFYYYKGVNLNPYLKYSSSFLDTPIFVYIEPTYVSTSSGVIAQSVKTRTLNYTTDPSIFDPLSPNYDLMAVQLGMVYISPAVDISDVVLVDARRRGGGAKDSLSPYDLSQIVAESSSYWDVAPYEGKAYQKSGFVIVRLPTQLHNTFTSSEIHDTIARNITAGVQFRVEDLQGNDW